MITTEEHILDEYGDFADNYEETLRGYGYVSDRLAPQMVDEELTAPKGLIPQPPWRILDMGCGTGNTAALYFKSPDRYSVVGIDLTPQMIEKARERPYERLLCQNIESKLQVDDASFSVVQFIGCTEFLNHPFETFTEARRKLQQNGLLLVTSPTKIRDDLEKKYQLRTWRVGELEAHVERSGFTHIR
eukprot:CAMPEP_0180657568 /NCGR_PEP_ID=MMETSP1037_2-20121125/56497_1 /TAXON_ID=632150 /ORGANISM="Azadinium spinosum, Strain 3D9" /LENGTH=187 /DNA_ID=CAMNT_0022684311 /DNA_START=28 /DNA_END=587 /DNA_ORIENTATION=+